MNLKKHIKDIIYLINPHSSLHKEEIELRAIKYNKSHPAKSNHKARYICMFDGQTRHGGLSDRLRGIVSLYTYCKINNINFKIYHVHPFNLSDYLVPNKYDWKIKSSDISFNIKKSKPIFLFTHHFKSCYHKLYLKLNSHYNELHIYTNTDIYDNLFSSNFNELFKPSVALQAAIEYNLKELGNQNFFAYVLRFQQLLGDFKEDGYEVLPEEEQIILINKCINKIKELADNKGKILVTSDSQRFLHEISKYNFVYTIPGNVVHMDYTYNSSFDTYLKSFTDLLVLSKATKITLLVSGKMYKSGFAKRAALISNTQYEEIDF